MDLMDSYYQEQNRGDMYLVELDIANEMIEELTERLKVAMQENCENRNTIRQLENDLYHLEREVSSNIHDTRVI
jgi:FMN-dependent NADH-azoreductase